MYERGNRQIDAASRRLLSSLHPAMQFVAFFRTFLVFVICLELFCSAQNTNAKSNQPPMSQELAELYSDGMDALNRQDLPAARKYFETIVRQTPRSHDARNLLGSVTMAH